MSKLPLMIPAANGDNPGQQLSKRSFFLTRRSERGSFTSKLLSDRVSSPAGVSKADRAEEALGAFYIGVGDQFDDDRRRVHIVK